MYVTLRSIHLFLASFSLPFLLMYGISAVQMTHSEWFDMKPTVREIQVVLATGITDARAVARDVMEQQPGVRGELTAVQTTAIGCTFRLVLPGTVHEVHYERISGATAVKSSVAGVLGMLNRLHHAAGLWHEPAVMKMWAMVVAIVSAALLVMGATGIWMWFLRRQERVVGAALLTVNVVFVVTVLLLLRVQGP